MAPASVKVRIPAPLRTLTGGIDEVSASGATVADVLADLDARHGGFRERLLDDGGRLHRFVNLYVNDEDVRFLKDLDTRLEGGDILTVVPAIAGGGPRPGCRAVSPCASRPT